MNRFILNLRSVDSADTTTSRVGNIGSDLRFRSNPDAANDTWPEVLGQEEAEVDALDQAHEGVVQV